MLFRKFLIRLRKEYNTNKKNLYIYTGLVAFISVVAGLAADMFLPFNGLANILRSVILLPTSLSLFILCYSIGLRLHYKQSENPAWVPFRSRMSPSWRRRIAVIVLALLLLIVYGTGFNVGYTLISSSAVVVGIVLFAFIRTTKQEEAREEFNIPDDRDLVYNEKMDELAEQRAIAKERAKERKEKKENHKDDSEYDEATEE